MCSLPTGATTRVDNLLPFGTCLTIKLASFTLDFFLQITTGTAPCKLVTIDTKQIGSCPSIVAGISYLASNIACFLFNFSGFVGKNVGVECISSGYP